MKPTMKAKKQVTLLIFTVLIFFVAIGVLGVHGALKANAAEIDYTFEQVPVESITLTADEGVTEIQPRQRFTLSYELNPWYTTTTKVYFDVFPQGAATVAEVKSAAIVGGRKVGKAEVTVASDAVIDSTFTVIASADQAESNPVRIKVLKIPVTGLALSSPGSDDKLHVGKTRSVVCNFSPSYATNQNVRYEITGSGQQYIESFDQTSGVITAKKNIAGLDINSTVTITAYSVDNPYVSDTVTFTLYLATTVVDLSATTPRGGKTSDQGPLAIAGSSYGETVSLHTKINGIASSGLNYVIVSGHDYIVNGLIRADGTFDLKPTVGWTAAMRVPHAEIKIKVAYSDGFDEITVSVYVPVESISFTQAAPVNVENFRSYSLQAEAFPKYASYLADHAAPISYSLNGLSDTIASVDSGGSLTLPRSLTSKNTAITYSAYLPNAWEGVDAAPLNHVMNIVPVYAEGFASVKILKGNTPIDSQNVKVLPNDTLGVEVEYTTDNVTELDFSVNASSEILSVNGSSVIVASLEKMKSDNPFLTVKIGYNKGGREFSKDQAVSIYVPAESAAIKDAVFNRGETLDLNKIITLNGHGYATDKTIEWGTPTLTSGKDGLNATCIGGQLWIASRANAGTRVNVPYRTQDSRVWQYKEFTVAPLSGTFSVSYGQADKAENEFIIDSEEPLLEENQSINLRLKFNGLGANEKFGLTYAVGQISANATLTVAQQTFNYDTFLLYAKKGQSGKNNFISYSITVYDGTSVYYVRSDNTTKLGALECVTKAFGIFNRIDDTVGVSNLTLEKGDKFVLTGWDTLATAEESQLVWKAGSVDISNERKMPSISSGFVLTISYSQKYNKQQIQFTKQISFNSITYMQDSTLLERMYKQIDSKITIANGYLSYVRDHTLEGWTTKNGSKSIAYKCNTVYSGTEDLLLYAYFAKTFVDTKFEGEQTFDENQNKNLYTAENNINLLIDDLRSLGYSKIKIDMDVTLQRTLHDGNFASLWFDVNGSTVFSNRKFQPNGLKSIHSYTVDVDITKFTDTSKVRFGFYTDDDGIWGKYTWKFYEAVVSFTAIR